VLLEKIISMGPAGAAGIGVVGAGAAGAGVVGAGLAQAPAKPAISTTVTRHTIKNILNLLVFTLFLPIIKFVN
jgi:hypothetical protein